MATVTNFIETRHAASFILSEGPINYSRDNIVVASGAGVLLPGTVIGKVAQGTLAAGTPAVGGSNVGNATIAKDGSTPLLEGAEPGTYRITNTDATHFTVVDANGVTVGIGVFGTAFANEIKFTITAGATPCVAGDTFTFPVTGGVAGAGKFKSVTANATDGTQTAAAILIYGVDATSADVPVAAITRHAQVNAVLLFYADQHTPTQEDPGMILQMNADLAKQGIIVRPAVVSTTAQ